MSGTMVWIIIAVVGVGTLLLRSSFIFALDKAGDMTTLQQILRFVPPSVLAALVASGLFLREDAFEMGPGGIRVIAGLGAALIAWKTQNILATIAGGMGLFWLVSYLI